MNIPYGKHHITEEDIKAVVSVLKSDYLTQGPNIGDFEEAFANYVNAKYAIAVANGTAALHLCALALNVTEQTNVITTPITFAASANCIRYCGGNVYFADINPATYLLDIHKVEKLIKSKPANFFSGIIPVDFAGYAVDLEAFKTLASKYNLWIIEDACHAPGGYFPDSKGHKQLCGNSNFADLAIFSFHPVKHIACGEGGMITTNNEQLYKKLLQLRTHGITRNKNNYTNSLEFANSGENQTEYPAWYMEMQMLGYNYRLTDFQAALGLSQLKRADEGLAKRREIAKKYDEAFKNILGVEIQFKEPNINVLGHAYHLYIIQVKNRLNLYNYLRGKNIYAQIHYIPAHLMPYYKSFGWKEGDFPIAEDYYKKCLSLPMYPTLSEEEQLFVIQSVKSFYGL